MSRPIPARLRPIIRAVVRPGARAQLSVIMPAYNEAEHIERSISEWHDGVVAVVGDAELVVVDDASTDGTGERLQQLRRRMPALTVVRLPRNVGHGPAIRVGLDACQSEFIFQTDSDRQHTPDDFWKVWEQRDAADFVFGVRPRRADGAFRRGISALMRVVNLLVWGVWLIDANCPFKLMRRSALEPLLADVPRDTFIPMVMIAVLAKRRGLRVREVPIRHFARQAGQQTLAGLKRWATVAPRCVGEIVALRRQLRRPAVGE